MVKRKAAPKPDSGSTALSKCPTGADGLAQAIGGELPRGRLTRMVTEERLRRSEQLYKEVVELTDAAVVRCDTDGHRTFVNEAFVRRHGKPAEELLKGTIGDQMVPEDVKKELELLRQCIATGQPVRGFLSRHVNDGQTLYTRGNLTPIRGAAGKVVGAQVTSVDVTDLMEAQERLRQSEELYRGLLNSVGASVLRVDKEGRRTFVSDDAAKSAGVTREQMLAGRFGDLIVSPEEREKAWALLRETFQTGKPVRSFLTNEMAPGGPRYFSANWEPIRDAHGDVVELQVTTFDVTELMEAQERARRSEARYQSLVESTGGVVIRVDVEGRRTFVNDNAGKFYGVDIEEIRKGRFGDRMTQKERERAMALLRETFRTGVPVHTFVTRQTVRGKPRWISATWVPIKDAKGKVVEIQTTSFDLTAQVEAQERLRESEALYRSLMHAATVGISRIDRQGKLLFANSYAAEMAGTPLEEYRKGVLGDTLRPEGKATTYAALQEVFETGKPVRDLVTHVDMEGKQRIISSNWQPIKDSKGRVVEAQITSVDITRQQKLEGEYFQAQKMESVGRLAGGVAHDFNNLLTVIMGYAEVSASQLPDGSPLRGYIQEIQMAGERAASLTRQLLAFSRRQIVVPKVIDLNELILNVGKMLQRLIGEDVQMVTMPASELWSVRVDPGQMEQVLVNLAVNSRDAMPRGGKLTIETANVTLDESYASTHGEVTPGDYVLLSVSDTGSGMTEDVKAHLFEPFFTTKKVGEGTGLGLATCYGIVKQADGHIWVYSEPGQGTSVKVYLPRVQEEVEAPARAGERSRVFKGTETVLVAEDEPAVRAIAGGLLRTLGYTVLVAESGAQALRVAREHSGPIHLLLTDVVMPEMSGKVLAERLKAQCPDILVLYTSGYTANAIVHHGVLDSGTAFLQKPFTAATLAEAVRQMLDEGEEQ